MMSSTLGASLGGTTRGGHQVFDPWSVSLITPPNFGGGGGSCVLLIVVLTLGEPGTPVVCCAVPDAALAAAPAARKSARKSKELAAPWVMWISRVTSLRPA